MPPSRARINGLLCSSIVGVCALLSRPFVEMGVYDDWSYIKTAMDFAKTGHILYNGWATAMLGWQIVWGALFVKLFGPSFTVVRLSTLPIAMATVYLFYEILRSFGVTKRNAVLGTLTLGLSPPFLFFSVTFMSDIPGLFCIILCLYCCQRALHSASDLQAVTWLVVAGVTNTIGGTVRQIAWLGVLVMVPCTGWILRKRRGAIPATILVWLAGVVGVYLSLHWFLQQPYSVPEKLILGPVTSRTVLHLLRQMSRAIVSLPLLALPLLVAWLTAGPSRSRAKAAALSISLCLVAAFLLVLGRHHNLDPYLAPWLGNPKSRQGMFDFVVLLGDVPEVLSIPFRILLSLLVLAATAAFLDRLFTQGPGKIASSPDALTVRWREILVLTGPFSLAYLALLMPRAAFLNLFNRYLLPFLRSLFFCCSCTFRSAFLCRCLPGPSLCWPCSRFTESPGHMMSLPQTGPGSR
jgi:hypothetical protein